jgi:hypothetical protein
MIATYLKTAEAELSGFSIAPAIYFHFSGAPATSKLPARPRDTMSLRSPIFLADVDPKSPERGLLFPLETRYFATALRYIPAGTLAVKPLPGFVLRPFTLYAAVVRRDLGDSTGQPLGTTADFERIKWTSPLPGEREERARLLHNEPLSYLASLGVARGDIAAMALFRTGEPHAASVRLFEAAMTLPPEHAPRVISAEFEPNPPKLDRLHSYSTITGYYCTPNFQSQIDDAPFLQGGGTLVMDPRGSPLVVEIPASSRYHSDECGGLLRARFVLTIPKAPMPASGFPLLIAAHGTGGSAKTFLGDDNFAGWAASQGVAAASTDQPLHGSSDDYGARPGSREGSGLALAGLSLKLFRGQPLAPELLFYNPINAGATRDNLRQAGIDASLLARALFSADFTTLMKPNGGRRGHSPSSSRAPLAPGGEAGAIHFDPTKLLFAGHSQGSQAAAVQAVIDPLVRGVLLSGCGGDARLGILRRNDLAIMPFIEAALKLSPSELTEFHPFMTLVQSLIDPVEPQSYARYYRDPLPGRRPQNVLHYGGLIDTYSPPETGAALAVALRATPLRPLYLPVRGLSLLGLHSQRGPIRGNIAGGKATAVYAQIPSTLGEDGHFVLFYEPHAASLAMQFIKSTLDADSGPAEIGRDPP